MELTIGMIGMVGWTVFIVVFEHSGPRTWDSRELEKCYILACGGAPMKHNFWDRQMRTALESIVGTLSSPPRSTSCFVLCNTNISDPISAPARKSDQSLIRVLPHHRLCDPQGHRLLLGTHSSCRWRAWSWAKPAREATGGKEHSSALDT